MFGTPHNKLVPVEINGHFLGETTVDVLMLLMNECDRYFEEGLAVNWCCSAYGDDGGHSFGVAEIGFMNLCAYSTANSEVNIYPIEYSNRSFIHLVEEVIEDVERDFADWIYSVSELMESDLAFTQERLTGYLDAMREWIENEPDDTPTYN